MVLWLRIVFYIYFPMSAWHSAYALILLITGLHFENCPIVKLTFPLSDDIAQATSGNYKTGLDAYNTVL